ncbi:dihydroorotase [soil metagenome]
MATRILRGATVVDGWTAPRQADVVIDGDRITTVVPAGQAPSSGASVSDVTGLLLMPGLVDIQVHFREPGAPDAEDIASGSRGAAAGGMTAVVMMPNTTPPLDSADIVANVLASAADAVVDVHTSACLSVGRGGERLVDFSALHAAGVRIFTDDGNVLADAGLMRDALIASTTLPGMVVSQHAEDESLVAGGAINDGPTARRLGVGGRPREAEEVIVARDVALARMTGGRYHVLHLSTSLALAHVRRARAEGVRVTCEVTPQHLVLTEGDVERLGTSGKMNPPLRTAEDVDALRVGVADGTVDAIATDHAPHAPDRKALPLDQAPPGMLGVETAAAVVWTHLVRPGLLSPTQAVQLLSVRPAAIAGLHRHGGPVVGDRPANLCLLDPAASWVVAPEQMASRSLNSPFAGDTLTGRVRLTIRDGEIVHDAT